MLKIKNISTSLLVDVLSSLLIRPLLRLQFTNVGIFKYVKLVFQYVKYIRFIFIVDQIHFGFLSGIEDVGKMYLGEFYPKE